MSTAPRKTTARKPHAVDPVWQAVCDEARPIAERDPSMTTFIHGNILCHETLEDAVIHRIANRLHHHEVQADIIRRSFKAMLEDQPTWSDTLRIDIAAVFDRDPACDRFIRSISKSTSSAEK